MVSSGTADHSTAPTLTLTLATTLISTLTTLTLTLGLDIPNVEHVVQFEFATNVVQYLHRLGRTGRAGGAGRVTHFFDPSSDLQMLIKKATENGEPVSCAHHPTAPSPHLIDPAPRHSITSAL